ncbi:MAG TPA: amidohydrolase family protein [Chloroflexia bacterium]|nr:amidohydrolase family protein [Chloroflexia bacterium]
MISDFHTHVFPDEVRADREGFLEREAWFGSLYADPKRKLASAEDVVASMEEAGVDRTVVLGFPWRDGGLCKEHNSYLLDAVRRYPDRLIGFGIVQPLDAGDAKEIDRCLSGGLMGMGEVGPDSQRYDLEAKWVLADSVEVLLHHDRPLLTHSSEPLGHDYAGKGTVTPPRLLKLASNFPDLKIVMAHWGGGLPFYELMPEVRETLRNVYYDTAASTYLYSFDIFPIAAQLIGSGRVLWGTDFPLLSQAKFLQRVRECGLNGEQLEDVLGGNAARLLRL